VGQEGAREKTWLGCATIGSEQYVVNTWLNAGRLSSKWIRTKVSHPNRYIIKDYQLPLRLHWGGFLLFADPTLTAPGGHQHLA
jgi:hypothetical protein